MNDWNEPRDTGPTQETEHLAEESPSPAKHKGKRQKHEIEGKRVLREVAWWFHRTYQDDPGKLREIEQDLQAYAAERRNRYKADYSRMSKFSRDWERSRIKRFEDQINQFCKELRS